MGDGLGPLNSSDRESSFSGSAIVGSIRCNPAAMRGASFRSMKCVVYTYMVPYCTAAQAKQSKAKQPKARQGGDRHSTPCVE